MTRRIHDIMSAQLRTKTVTGTDAVEWEDGIRSHIAKADTTAAQGELVCRGRNLASPTSVRFSSASTGLATYTALRIGPWSLPAGTYSMRINYRQLGELANVSASIRDYDSISVNYGDFTTQSAATGTLFKSFTIPEGSRGISVYLYSNRSASVLATECEFYDMMLVRGGYTSATMPSFEEFYDGGSMTLPLSGAIKLRHPTGYGQVLIGSNTSGNRLEVKYVTR